MYIQFTYTVCLFVYGEQDWAKYTQTPFCLWTLTLGQKYINKPFSVVSEKVKEMYKQCLIYRQMAPQSLYIILPEWKHKIISPQYRRKY